MLHLSLFKRSTMMMTLCLLVDPLSIVITKDNIIAHWDSGTQIELVFDANQIDVLLDDIYKDQTILLNSNNQ